MKQAMRSLLACALCALLLAACLPLYAAADGAPTLRTDYQPFVYQNRVLRQKKVMFYDDVYARNHNQYLHQPFDASVPARFFIVDGLGRPALAPYVLDITDAMRVALYGADVGYTALFYGQYTEKVRSADRKLGYSGIHEGIDFVSVAGQPIHAILGGEVLRRGRDKDGTISIYNQELDVTVLYLHTRDSKVERGQLIAAGTQIGVEGDRGSGAPYTHVEVRFGRHETPSPYRNTTLQSDLPYDIMARALQVEPTDRAPLTAEAVYLAEQERAAEAARLEEERMLQEAADRLAAQQAEEAPEVLTGDDAPADTDLTEEGFGFAEQEAGDDADPENEK